MSAQWPLSMTVVFGSDGSSAQPVTMVPRVSPGECPGENAGIQENSRGKLPANFPHAAHGDVLGRAGNVAAVDPFQVRKDMPALWAAYLQAAFRGNVALIMRHYTVSERTARTWLRAEGGVNGAQIVTALRSDPERAFTMLIAAE